MEFIFSEKIYNVCLENWYSTKEKKRNQKSKFWNNLKIYKYVKNEKESKEIEDQKEEETQQ